MLTSFSQPNSSIMLPAAVSESDRRPSSGVNDEHPAPGDGDGINGCSSGRSLDGV